MNKMDRETAIRGFAGRSGRGAQDPVCAVTGHRMGKSFARVPPVCDEILLLPGRSADQEFEAIRGIDNPRCRDVPARDRAAQGRSRAVRSALPVQPRRFLDGSRPVFFGSAVNNFGVRDPECADRLGPGPARARCDAAHRGACDPILRLRVQDQPTGSGPPRRIASCGVSGRFERGMKISTCASAARSR